MVPGQGEIHDALFFMTSGISGRRYHLLVNVVTSDKVSTWPGPRSDAGMSCRQPVRRVIVRSHPVVTPGALP